MAGLPTDYNKWEKINASIEPDEEDLALPKLALCYVMMTRRLHTESVRYVKTMGNCQGVLQCAELWRKGPQRRASSEQTD